MDVLLFDEDFNEVVVTVISSEEDPDIKIKLDDPKKHFFILNLSYKTNNYRNVSTTNFLSTKLNSIKDTLTRALVWKAIQAMVKTCRVKSTLYFTYIKQKIYSS